MFTPATHDVFDPEEMVGTPRGGVREWPFTVAYKYADGAARRPYHWSAIKAQIERHYFEA